MRFNVHTTAASKRSRMFSLCQVNFRKFFNIFTVDRYTHGTSPPFECSGRFAFPSGLDPGG